MSAIDSGALQQHGLGFKLPTSPPRARAHVLASSLIEEDAASKAQRVARTGMVLLLQGLLVGGLLLIPFVVTEAIDLHQLNKTLLIAPAPPSAPPVARAQAIVPRPSILHAELTAPALIPKKIVAVSDLGAAAPAISEVGGIAGGTGDVLGGSLAGAPPPPPAAAPARPKGPIRISTGMKEPRLLSAPPIEYSPIARQAHVQGTVLLEAVIDEQGNVTQVRAISGPALLFASAIKAVAARKYEPTYLDGQAVAVRLDVTVNFKLS